MYDKNSPAASPRHARRMLALASIFALATFAGCSNTDTNQANAPSSTAGTTGAPVTTINADHRLAAAKTVAVGFFEAQAVNAFDKALAFSSGGAATSIKWARAVNTLAPANGTPYQVPTVAAPNVRVQIDQLNAGPGSEWTASGFVELSFRPGPVASTTTQAPSPGSTTVPRSPSTYVVDLVFSGDGENLRLDDYRLDDTPYPVSQLFLETSAKGETGTLSGTALLGHRDLDGSVQYISEVTNSASQGTEQATSTFFIWTPPGTTEPPTQTPGQLLADTTDKGATTQALSVFPGLFPGSAGTLRLEYGPATGTTSVRNLDFVVPDFAPLTPKPVNVVAQAQASVPSTSSTSTSTSTSVVTPTTPTTSASTSTSAVTTTPPVTATTTTSSSTTTTQP